MLYTRINDYSAIEVGRLYTNGKDIRVVTYAKTPIGRKSNIVWKKFKAEQTLSKSELRTVKARSFRDWVNKRPKDLSTVVYANAIDMSGLLFPKGPVECHWDDKVSAWVLDDDFGVPKLGQSCPSDVWIFFASEREAEVVAWMKGVGATMSLVQHLVKGYKKWGMGR
jgi:hypothetical protein